MKWLSKWFASFQCQIFTKILYHVCDAMFEIISPQRKNFYFSTPNNQNSGKIMEEKSPTKIFWKFDTQLTNTHTHTHGE